MTFTEIKALSDMGFTNDQIMTLNAGQPVQPEQPPEDQPEQPPEHQPEQPPEHQPEQPPEDSRISEMQKQIDDLKKQIQKQNRQQARMETMPDDLDKSVDSIMAELIRPTIKEG